MKVEIASRLFLDVLTGHRQWVSVKEACDRLKNAGYEAVLAGGSVRDGLLGVSPKDFDVATNATPDQVEALFEKSISIGKAFGVIGIPIQSGEVIEIATFRRDGSYADGRRPATIEFADMAEDAKRRDFTVNALFFNPATNQILDEVGGLNDLASKILRVVGDPEKRFEEDKLRLLRAARFAGQLNFEIEPATASAVQKFAPGLQAVSRERVRDEIDKLLTTENAAFGFNEMARLGLAKPVFADWATWLFPIDARAFTSASLEVRRAVLLYPALARVSPDRIRERLRAWKYGRAFCDLIVWLIGNETKLRPSVAEPASASLKSKDAIIRDFQIGAVDERVYSLAEQAWMDALELWTNERAGQACAILDVIYGQDSGRDAALGRRGLTLGLEDPLRAKAADLLSKPSGKTLEGARLGRELRRLNREILRR